MVGLPPAISSLGRILLNCVFVLFVWPSLFAQVQGHFFFDTFSVAGWPNIHSFAFASSQNKVLMLGGRTDGIHPKESGFEYDRSNKYIYVWNAENMQITGTPLQFQDPVIRGFLSSANTTFAQDENYLYMMGGYGENASGSYHTYPFLARIHIADCIRFVESSQDPGPAFEFIQDSFFAVAGGQLRIQDTLFYLVGGNYFEGKYSSNSSNTKQMYTDAFVIFKLRKDPDSLRHEIVFHKTDDYNFHRRDFNMSPFIDDDGKEKLMVYSGVFQYNLNRPFLNTSVIHGTQVEEVFDFDQKFCAYNCARIHFFDKTNNRSHQLFFGGMAEYYRDSVGEMVHDSYVPFVKSVSCVSRDESGRFAEWLLKEELPGYLGCNAEIYLNPGLPFYSKEIINLDLLPVDTQFIGYIFGGIYNPGPDRNPWQNDSAHLTHANPYVIKINFLKNNTSQVGAVKNKKSQIDLELFPNPAHSYTHLKWKSELPLQNAYIWIQDIRGRIIHTREIKSIAGPSVYLDLETLSTGIYNVYILANHNTLLQTSLKVLKK